MIVIRPQVRARPAARTRQGLFPRRGMSERGVTAIVFLLMLIAMMGFVGMALDLGRVYNRKVELQHVADAAALAAARELNGTSAGVTAAITRASTVVAQWTFQYGQKNITWSDSALQFGAGPSGPWISAGAAPAAANGLLFAKIDTSELAPEYGAVGAIFMGLISGSNFVVTTKGYAIAGRSSINVLPLAVCAMSSDAATARVNPGPPANTELVEYGFRRGVGYDLMRLNPGGTTAENFVIDPINPPGVAGSSSNTTASMVGPFVCDGSMAMGRVTGGAITVTRPFPLDSLYDQLNSRFDLYVGNHCSPSGSPPDANIRSYTFATTSWMTPLPTVQSAASTTADGSLRTIADPLPAPAGNTAPMYGPLWTYARAVPFSSYSSGSPEPAGGYATFATSAWSTLYRPGQPAANLGFPAVDTPYRTSTGVYFLAPSVANRPGIRHRRVLNVPLLACPIGGGSTTQATVLAIGKFFMTVPATATSLHVEFAGVVPEQTLGGQLELYP